MSIIDKLFIKRFCLPSETDVSNKKDIDNILPCLCGDYNHVACTLKGKDRYSKK